MFTNPIYHQAAENVAGEQVSVELDGTVWADADHRIIDAASVQAEYERLVAEKEATRAALLARLGLSADEFAVLVGGIA